MKPAIKLGPAERRGSAVVARARTAAPASRTLKRLKLLQATALVTLAVWASVGITAAVQSHDALLDAERSWIPQATAAQQIQTSLSMMDAATAQQLRSATTAKDAQSDLAEQSRTEVVRALIDTAESGGADREALATLESGLGTYGQLVQRVRDLRDRSDPAQAAVYREAVSEVEGELLPRAKRLDSLADSRLRELARQQQHYGTVAQVLFVCAALLATVTLLAAQLFLSQSTRRTLNPALLAATLICAVGTGSLMQAGGRVQADAQRALSQAYPALHAGWRARAEAAAAKDWQGRAALEADRSAADRQRAAEHRSAVATLPLTLSGDQLLGALREGRDVEGFSGLLAEELESAPRSGEREAVIQALAAWLRTETLRTGQAGQGSRPAPESDSNVQAFPRALDLALQAHGRVLTVATEDALAEQAHAELLLGLLAALSAFLVLVGFAPRLREYQ